MVLLHTQRVASGPGGKLPRATPGFTWPPHRAEPPVCVRSPVLGGAGKALALKRHRQDSAEPSSACIREAGTSPRAQKRRQAHPCLFRRDAAPRGSAVAQPQRVIPYPAPGEGTAVGCPWKWPQGLHDIARMEEARRTLLALLREASSPTCPAGQLREE